jgi:hypothetical protein
MRMPVPGQCVDYVTAGTEFNPTSFGDNCSATTSYSLAGSTAGAGNSTLAGVHFNVGTTTVTWQAIDPAGNTATCSFSVSVTCIQLSGTIKWEQNPTMGVKDVDVTATGGSTATSTSNSSGFYSIPVNATGSFTLTPLKTINGLNGVTAADATRIQQHIANTNPLPGAYKRIAADINKSNSITTFDATIITQALAGNPTYIAYFNPSWRFVPVSYVFPNPNVPWGFPETISLSNVTGNVTGQDFYGVKLGDVNGSASPLLTPGAPLTFTLDDRILEAGEEVTVAFNASHFVDLAAYQFAIWFDPGQLQVAGIQSGTVLNLTDENFGTFKLDEGELRAVWAQAKGVTIGPGSKIFQIRFKMLQSGLKLSDVIRLDNDILEGHAYNESLAESAVKIQFRDVQTSTDNPVGQTGRLALYQNIPNPFVDQTLIGFNLPEACEAHLRIFDTEGRLITERSKFYPAGYQEELFHFEMTNPSVLYYELTTPFGQLARKMVAISK